MFTLQMNVAPRCFGWHHYCWLWPVGVSAPMQSLTGRVSSLTTTQSLNNPHNIAISPQRCGARSRLNRVAKQNGRADDHDSLQPTIISQCYQTADFINIKKAPFLTNFNDTIYKLCGIIIASFIIARGWSGGVEAYMETWSVPRKTSGSWLHDKRTQVAEQFAKGTSCACFVSVCMTCRVCIIISCF